MMLIYMLTAIILLVPILKFIVLYGFILYFVLVACAMFFALKVEKKKRKKNDIQTYIEGNLQKKSHTLGGFFLSLTLYFYKHP